VNDRSTLPSVRLASVTERVGEGSSSVIVPRALESEIVAPEALDRLTRKRSSVSSSVSPWTGTRMVLDVVPGANVSVPEVDV
jgi:hypothetical protein